jgi:hypothetical protein
MKNKNISEIVVVKEKSNWSFFIKMCFLLILEGIVVFAWIVEKPPFFLMIIVSLPFILGFIALLIDKFVDDTPSPSSSSRNVRVLLDDSYISGCGPTNHTVPVEQLEEFLEKHGQRVISVDSDER